VAPAATALVRVQRRSRLERPPGLIRGAAQIPDVPTTVLPRLPDAENYR
jgi:hypothetical protein